VHATFKAVPRVGSLREVRTYNAVEEAIAKASRPECRIVQGDHLHCIVEASDRAALLRGLRGLAIRTTRGIRCT
jgi:hypothetical protein